jgi:hypothetical protein
MNAMHTIDFHLFLAPNLGMLHTLSIMRPKVIYPITIFMNFTWRIKLGIKERHNFLPWNRWTIFEQPIPLLSSAFQ